MKKHLISFIAGATIFGCATAIASTFTTSINPFNILLNGQKIQMEGYNINGSTYFKLRDISSVIGGFDVDFKDNAILLSKDGYKYDNFQEEDLFNEYYINTILEKYPDYVSYECHSFSATKAATIVHYIDDFDADGKPEMMVIVNSGPIESGSPLHTYSYCRLQLYEVENDTVILADDRQIDDSLSSSYRKIDFFLHEYNNKKYVCATSCRQGINGGLATAHILFSYNGKTLIKELHLEDDGASSGETIYSIPENTNSRYDGVEIYPRPCNDYEQALASAGNPYGLVVVPEENRDRFYDPYAAEFRENYTPRRILPTYTSKTSTFLATLSFSVKPNTTGCHCEVTRWNNN